MPYRPQRIPARNPSAARRRFVDFLAQSLSCLDRQAVWLVGTPERKYAAALPDDARSLVAANTPVTLLRGDADPLYLAPAQTFQVVRDDHVAEVEYRVHTLGYIYMLTLDALLQHVLLQWHYHPYIGRQGAHIHVIADASGVGGLGGLHIPTGRVSFESLVRFLITDMGVEPARKDWQDVLDDTEQRFVRHRRWS